MTDNTRPDIKFESDYIRIVYEVITSSLRSNKKVVEKEINAIVNKISSLKKKPLGLGDSLTTVKGLIKKANELQEKYKIMVAEEDKMYKNLKERILEIKLIEGDNYTHENLKIFCEKKINNLILDFFLREKHLESAKNYINDEKINMSLEYSIFCEIDKIVLSLKQRDPSHALNWCNTNKSKLTKLNSSIKFKLLKQQFIELIKKEQLIDAIKFARESFKEFTNYEEIQELMILLAIKPKKLGELTKYKYILSEDRWPELENEFKQVFFQIYSMKSNSPLEVLFQSGLMSLKTVFCYQNKNKICPVCCDNIGSLAKTLPSSLHPGTSLICRITGEIMDEKNPPIAFPNGQVYSEKAVNTEITKNGTFTCPKTGKIYKEDQKRKVFIC